MRDNGLTAADYTSLGRIDPAVADPVLAALAAAGIAAYTSPPAAPADAAAEPAQAQPPLGSGSSETPADETPAAGDTGPEQASEPADAPSGETARSEAARGEAARSEAARSEAARGEAARGEAPLGEAARREVAGGEPAGGEETEPAERESAVKAAAASVPVGSEELFVDSAQVEAARPVIARSTEDAEWKSLVEQFNAPSAPGHDASPVPRWPASEDVDQNSYEPLIDVPPGLDRTEAEPEPEQPARRRDDDPHDHFVPPEPPRGPTLDWISRLAWLGVIGGPVLLVVTALFDLGLGRVAALAVVGFVGGFLTLVLRMGDRLPRDDTPDDGAVV